MKLAFDATVGGSAYIPYAMIWHGSKMNMLNPDACQHGRTREIGEDFDEDGRLLRLVRCQKCGLVLREYLLTL